MKTTTITATLMRTLFWFWVTMGALEAEMRIKNVDEFLQFENNVNNGASYPETTVFLDSDIDLTGESFGPIGTNSEYQFRGVFDGQGYAISNLKMNSSSSSGYAGLFGYSRGLTIKNVILESSCSITSFGGSVGGFIGECYAYNEPCIIENSVNMGSVTFSGSGSLHLGGIAGELCSDGYDSTVKNCANYGDVTHSGTSGHSYIGGIVGRSYGSSQAKRRVYIYNSINHGTFTHNGTTTNTMHLGGIIGRTSYTTIENCVSGGKITSNKTTYIGSIVGGVSGDSYINYCYSTSELSGYNKYGSGTPDSEFNTLGYDNNTFQLNETVSIGSYTGNFLISALNAAADYYVLRSYSHWLLNKDSNTVSFSINGRTSTIKMDYQIILLPNLASEGNTSFVWWYTDSELTTPLASYEISSDTELYGKYCGPNFTVTLDVNGRDELAVREMAIGCNRVYGDLPTPARIGHTFFGWFTGKDDGEVELVKSNIAVKITQDHTLYAHWTINNYTLTIILGNGTEPEVRVLEFNEIITYPADPVRAGYSFNGWDTNITFMPANNTNITAQWTPNKYTVTFNASGGSISRSTKDVTFDSPYGDLPIPDKTGFKFSGWLNEMNEKATNESTVRIPGNHILHAHWTELPTNQVGVLINAGNLTREEIEEIIKHYTNDEFVIIKVDYESSGDTQVIIKFRDIEDANSFVEKVNALNDANATITKVGFIQGGAESFSVMFQPMRLFLI